ncbi:MAG: hypothetical protein QOD92_3874 [Acidimicrobiaceae bacterium]|jgi:hypothetical protein
MRSRWVDASVVVLVTTIVVLGAITPGYSQARDTVSRMASPGQAFALLAALGFVSYGVLVLLGTRSFQSLLVARLTGVYGVTAVIAGLAPKDPSDGTHTLASQIHVDATIIGGIAIITAMTIVGVRSPRLAARRGSLPCAVLTCATAFAFRYAWGSPVYGLVERAMLALAMGWLAWIARADARQSFASLTNPDQIETHSFQTAGG